VIFCVAERSQSENGQFNEFFTLVNVKSKVKYSGIPMSRTSRGNANWFEKSVVREIEGGIELRLIGRLLFDYE